jgi:hypothetical protein
MNEYGYDKAAIERGTCQEMMADSASRARGDDYEYETDKTLGQWR